MTTPDPDDYMRELRTADLETLKRRYRYCRDYAVSLRRRGALPEAEAWGKAAQEIGEVWADRVNLEGAVAEALEPGESEPPC